MNNTDIERVCQKCIAANILFAMALLGLCTILFYVGAIVEKFSPMVNHFLAGSMAMCLVFIIFQMTQAFVFRYRTIQENESKVKKIFIGL